MITTAPACSVEGGRPFAALPEESGRPLAALPEEGGRLFAALPARDAAAMARLRARLAEQAQHEGILDVAYRTLDTPVGSLLLAATAQGLVRVAFDVQGHDAALRQLAGQVSPRVLLAPRRLDEVSRQLEEYFAGRRTRFEVPLDWRLSKGFRLGVLRHLRDIGYGRTESYAEVAVAAGSPRAVRAVGTACATNPLPVVVPCHRVVRSDGSAGGYAGGADAKRALLALESPAWHRKPGRLGGDPVE
ncbi:methylated-DNA--[protein]-cysteine S-methyltransferase [Nonomuraea jiangxiensis]|uniref:Methylated-DNA--protein-cysteine methyltransferase n=1 Tax=Nonomuraea jiangxiensis TaxID=633440 RepID=A0A1G8TXU0_9ACTN|nr:methylated-DNA--[protein]-cysteine S-methyltransferase [Nonomuraea jiangxiensis]SDJ45705.1 methylated-DNA-[protein]-cysteine S-methyltransferase [Nonomuraea jiangxiensis]